MNYLLLFLLSFVISLVLYIILIPIFRKTCKQTVREEGMKSHYVKSGTPTMGGVVFISVTIFLYTIIQFKYLDPDINKWLLFIIPLLTYSMIGIIDDLKIIIKKNNSGISPKTKLIFQIIWAALYFYIYIRAGLDTHVNIFGLNIDFKWIYGLLILFLLVASSNAVNITDGLDGLAAGNIIIIFFSFTFITTDKTILSYISILLGGLIAFLCYNFHPAKIFMGDVGSLPLGVSLANIFIITKKEALLVIFAFVFIIETLSDIIQVWYYKKTNGKRVFKMAPLHHHLELCGLSEITICIIFWIITTICSLCGIYINSLL